MKTPSHRPLPTTDRIHEIITEQLALEPDEVTGHASFVDDLGADSLDLVELVMAIEEEYSLDIPDDDIEGVATVADLVAYVKRKAGAE